MKVAGWEAICLVQLAISKPVTVLHLYSAVLSLRLFVADRQIIYYLKRGV